MVWINHRKGKEIKLLRLTSLRMQRRNGLHHSFIPEIQLDSPLKVEVIDERKLKEKKEKRRFQKPRRHLKGRKSMLKRQLLKPQEREKRMKKKAGTNVAAAEPVEQTKESEKMLSEKLEESVKSTSPQNQTEIKKNVIRYKRPQRFTFSSKDTTQMEKVRKVLDVGCSCLSCSGTGFVISYIWI